MPQPFAHFSLPIQGLNIGIHRFKFDLDETFFNKFEDSPIGKSEIEVIVELDRRSDMMLFDFELSGWVETECDRCTAEINLKIEDERQLLVKFGELKEADDDEIVFLPHDASEFNLANYLYEFSIMAIPFIKTYDCENDAKPPCNFDILGMIGKEEDFKSTPNPVWEDLKIVK